MPADGSQEVATRSPQADLVQYARGDIFRQEVAAALPPDVPVARFIRATVTALMTTPELVELERHSLFTALVRCAADGLMPDGRQAALAPFKKKGSNVKRAQYLPMIGGYRKIAAEHGWSLRTNVVREGDDFELALGDSPVITHRPDLNAAGDVTGAYAIAVNGPRREVAYMSRAEIEKVRKTSHASGSGPWVEWFERMAEKTVGRRLFAKLPLGERDERMQRILDADELEPGEAAELVYGAREVGARAEGPSTPTEREAPAEPPAEPEPTREPEPEPAPEAKPNDVELGLAAVVLGDEFTSYAGRSIREIVDAGDRTYLRWLKANAEAEEIREAAAAGLAELS